MSLFCFCLGDRLCYEKLSCKLQFVHMENQRDRNVLDEENDIIGLVGNGMTPVNRGHFGTNPNRNHLRKESPSL